jgi:outer membrane lipoprotein-sorting protein
MRVILDKNISLLRVLAAVTAISWLILAGSPSSISAQEPEGKATAPAGDAADPKRHDPEDIIKKMTDLMRGESSYSEMKMTIVNPDWPKPRVYEMKGYEDKTADKSFVRITSPAKERGKAFLKVGNTFKVYIPTVRENKPMTIPPSLMLQPWMGSDFSNDDLVHQSSEEDDYEHKVVGVETDGDGVELVILRLDPKPDAPVVWGKILIWVRAEDYLPVKEVYYDEDGLAIREMNLSGIKEMGGRTLPTVWEMKSLEEDKLGRRTVIELVKIEFDIEIDPSIFSNKNLTRKDWE